MAVPFAVEESRDIVFKMVKQNDGKIRPSQLLRNVCHNNGFSYSQAQSALGDLLESHKVILTPDRYLRIRQRGEHLGSGGWKSKRKAA